MQARLVKPLTSADALAALAAFTTLALAFAARQDRRQFQVQLFHADGHEAQHVFVDRQLTFHFLHRRRGSVDGQQGVVSLAVLLDAIGEVAKAPVLDLGHPAALLFEQVLQGVVEGFGLLRRDVLPRDDDVFV